MKYVGSKNRHAKYILPIILKDRAYNQPYVEPFAGGCNVIDKVTGHRIASDINEYVIELLKAVADGWEPPSIVTQEMYYHCKENKDKYGMHYTAFIGFCCSFSGKWWGGYARSVDSKGNPRNHALEQRNNLIKQAPNLQGIEFYTNDYRDLAIPDNSIIYCDPPYEHTVKYRDGIDYHEFWNWCRQKKSEGHSVYVSSYKAPNDFKCLWSRVVSSSLDTFGGKVNVECLFTMED